jgi:hypothetical protein
MSLYREAGRARRNRRIAIGAAVGVIVLVVAIVLLATSGGPPSHADRVKSAKSAASEALDGLEVLSVEYAQAVKGGQVAAPTEYGGAKADVQRIRQTLADHRADFEAADPAAYRRATVAVGVLATAVARRSDIAAPLRATRAALQPFAA